MLLEFRYGTILLFLSLLISSGVMISLSAGRGHWMGLMDRYPPEIACIDRLAGTYHLNYGLADYWNAKYISLFSRAHLKVNQMDYLTLSENHILNNREWYDRARLQGYHFIVASNLNRSGLEAKFGRPDFKEACGSDVLIYLRPIHLPGQ